MKKAKLTLLAMSASFAAMAQQDPDLTDAILNHKNGLLDKARVSIEKAIVKDKVYTKPKGWYERGAIYIDIVNTQLPAFQGLAGDSGASVAYKSFKKAIELDKPDGSYAKDAKANMENVWVGVLNTAIKFDTEKKHKEAIDNYRLAMEMKPEDTLAYRNATYSAVDLNDYPQAKTYYDKLVTLKYKNLGMYKYMADFAQQNKKFDDALAILAQGRKDFPDNKNLLIDELNIYLTQNRSAEAKAKLDEAIKLDPSNTSLYLVKGDMLSKEASTKKAPAEAKALNDEALSLYNKALAVDSMSFEGNFNVGTFYYNQGSDLFNKANKMDLATYQRNGKKLETEAKGKMAQAVPYFEKAHKTQPKDVETLKVLSKLYGYLKRADKIAEVDEKLKALGK
ncbi:Tetratricopeptide repeat-containing protein [Flexibacter flexilis DSM 6793]|uniref:Tetratricopeptide repeat-containing protein n=1 Tax=Flexibacter flexilis DSM 6793 TaxID=927664 RepID=A0A1I1HMW4_9BACT|nr:tetratricopeptide repeat protein [Flexibacter flexilis]SFC25437.1 Tetratricopeptide repeat-containing protein [Flexibacter flexilis DSM 6793]